MLNAYRSETYHFFKVAFKYTKKFLAVDTIDVIGLYIFVWFYTFVFTAFTHTLTTFVFDLFVGSAPKGERLHNDL
jgi:hypothetical protein